MGAFSWGGLRLRRGHLIFSQLTFAPMLLYAEELGTDVHGLVAQLLAGVVATQKDVAAFHCRSRRKSRSVVCAVPSERTGYANPLNVLTIMGGETETIVSQRSIGRSRPRPRPYDSLQEIANEMSLGVLTQHPPRSKSSPTTSALLTAKIRGFQGKEPTYK